MGASDRVGSRNGALATAAVLMQLLGKVAVHLAEPTGTHAVPSSLPLIGHLACVASQLAVERNGDAVAVDRDMTSSAAAMSIPPFAFADRHGLTALAAAAEHASEQFKVSGSYPLRDAAGWLIDAVLSHAAQGHGGEDCGAGFHGWSSTYGQRTGFAPVGMEAIAASVKRRRCTGQSRPHGRIRPRAAHQLNVTPESALRIWAADVALYVRRDAAKHNSAPHPPHHPRAPTSAIASLTCAHFHTGPRLSGPRRGGRLGLAGMLRSWLPACGGRASEGGESKAQQLEGRSAGWSSTSGFRCSLLGRQHRRGLVSGGGGGLGCVR